jgi:uncharacterized protein with PIN domain
MLGSLARWLRLLGFDTLYCATEPDDEILDKVENRVLLSRDIALLDKAHRRSLKAVNPGEGSIQQMLTILQKKLGIWFSADPNQSRCSQCNTVVKPVPKEDVKSLVPKGSWKRHEHFWQCVNPVCQKVYWQGRHWTRIRNTLKRLNSND